MRSPGDERITLLPRNCRDPLLSTDRADTAATIAAQPQGSVRFLPFCQPGNRYSAANSSKYWVIASSLTDPATRR